MDAARTLATDLLEPTAEAVDQSPAVPRERLDALAGAGLCGLAGPVDAGGADAPEAVTRAVFEVLAGACGVTFFTWVQHHAPVRLLAASTNTALRDRWLADLCSGRVLGGVAFAYLRRPGPPAVVAVRGHRGWIVDGEAPFVTSWGRARLFAVAARAGGDVVWLAVDAATAGASLSASAPLALAVMRASCTVRLGFDALFVPDDDVIAIVPFARWRSDDRIATARPSPAPFGLAATAVRGIHERATRTGEAAVARAASVLGAELHACRSRSYALAGARRAEMTGARLAELVAARAWGLDVAVRSAQALVAAGGGGAMALGSPAQRLLREAAFWSIQAQTGALRTATLSRLER